MAKKTQRKNDMITYLARALVGQKFTDAGTNRIYEVMRVNVSPDPEESMICVDVKYVNGNYRTGVDLKKHLDDLELSVGQFEALFKKR